MSSISLNLCVYIYYIIFQFIYIYIYIYIYLLFFLQENLLNKIVFKQNKSNLAIRLCLPDDVMMTVMTSVTGSHYNTYFTISFGTCTSC